ncbi:helix-turn-helix domain-containing protein (plasmid) [Lactobacillus johnsonii]|uniref:Helix-turn-helix domain-containing protein n=1 Tax=Lactobacillus johnsonii TaxID=33959 RepID=A0A9X7T902_LACJH|nr:helix-turn-helix domain-containing protein [Lactobacillus johnsonii]
MVSTKGEQLSMDLMLKKPQDRLVWESVVSMLKKHEMSIKQIAEKVGISERTVYRIKKRNNL